MNNTASTFGISRIKYHNIPSAWKVNLCRPGERKPVVSKTFSDLRYQGKKPALKAAQAFRDERMAALGIVNRNPVLPAKGERVKQRPASIETSGRIGVSLVRLPKHAYWSASFMAGGVKKAKTWSISKYGYKDGWRLAVAWREQHDGLPSPKAPPPMPEWLKEWLASLTPQAKLRCDNTSGRVGVSLGKHRQNGEYYPSWDAWLVVDGQRKLTSWAIKKYGYGEAWRLAVAWRAQRDGLPSPKTPPAAPEWLKKWLASPQAKLRDGNTSGRVGVFLKRNHRYAYWTASFPVAGRRKDKSWSISNYGYEEAWRLAVAWREQHDGLPSPKAPPPMPEWVRELTASKNIREHKKGIDTLPGIGKQITALRVAVMGRLTAAVNFMVKHSRIHEQRGGI